MKNIHSIEFYTGSKEELLPGFEKDFPYIASRTELDKYIGGYVPWHWQRGQEVVIVISHECGLGSSSYFGKVFREYAHCSPIEYRKKWQNSDR